jgi:hypothetical protein
MNLLVKRRNTSLGSIYLMVTSVLLYVLAFMVGF